MLSTAYTQHRRIAEGAGQRCSARKAARSRPILGFRRPNVLLRIVMSARWCYRHDRLPPGALVDARGVLPSGIWLGPPSFLTSLIRCLMKPNFAPKLVRWSNKESSPTEAPTRTWGGPGVGAPCSVCGLPVTKAEKEFEIQFERDGDNPGLDKFHVHIRCFAAWEFERKSASK